MAKNSFLVFDEQGANIQTDAEYQSATQRIGGVLPGLAEPEMHNKLYRQTSIMAAAIGKVLAEAGYDASDANMTALAANIKALFVSKPLDAYPIGAIYISASGVNPAQLFGGTWEQIQGRFLLASSTNYAAGSTGGEANHTLSASEMPIHTHTITVNSAGEHAHAGTTTVNGSHTHGRGTMNIVGTFGGVEGAGSKGVNYFTGPFYKGATNVTNGYSDNATYDNDVVHFEAARNWTGETSANGEHAHTLNIDENGNHIHTSTASETGGGLAHNNMPPYLAVYVWKRTA